MFEDQIASNKVITEEYLADKPGKKFHSGRLQQAGDQTLFGIIVEFDGMKDGIPTYSANVINLHKDEVGVLYEEDIKYASKNASQKMPYIKLISK